MSVDHSLLEFLQNKRPAQANYRPIVIKTLLEKGVNENFSASIDEIQEKIILLNFDREDFQIKNAIDAVLPALKNYIFEKEDSISLDIDSFSDDEIDECLKICNKEIGKWHVTKIMKDENDIYVIQAGLEGIWLEEFKKSKTVGVDYSSVGGIFDLTGMTKDEIGAKTNGKAGTELHNISQLKKGDIVAIRSERELASFGIVTGNYFFDSESQTYSHKVNIEYLDFGTNTISGIHVKKAIFKTIKSREEIRSFLSQEEYSYFILRHNSDSPWDDLDGKYHFGRNVPNQKKLRDAGVNTHTIWYTKKNGQYYFWGYGIVKEIEVIRENEEWNLIYDDFQFFEKNENSLNLDGKFLKLGTELIKKQIENVPNFNNQHAMTKITKKIYQQIIGEDLTSEDDELDTMSMDNYDRALKWKPNLILYGPPGTGKTFHANKIAEKIAGSIPKFKEQTWLSVGAKILLNTNGNELGYDDFAEEATKIKDASVKTPEQTITRDIRTAITNSNSDSIFTNNSDGKYGLRLPTTFVEAARLILLAENRPMHSDEITEIAIKKQMINQRENPGITPNRSMNQILSQDVKNNNLNSNFIQTAPGTYALRNQILNEKELLIYKVTFHPSYSYEDFVEGFRPNTDKKSNSQYVLEKGIFWKACETAKQHPNDKVVLIIDEINRGNIPKILGELITLIEKDKRSKENSLKLTYSKDDFFVPENLIIIGTMNTADKSLMQMDDALKRRFVFEELMPDTDVLLEHLKEKNIAHAKNYSQILKRINEKILGKGNGNESERMKQFRDRQIGHSYFWDLANDDDLQTVMKYDIIPLLQDYFYGDYNEIRKILGKGFDGKDATIIGEDNRPTELVNDKSKNTQLKEKLLEI